MPRYNTALEFNYPVNHSIQDIKEIFVNALLKSHFDNIKFLSFNKISITKEEAVELIAALSKDNDPEIVKNIIERIN
jgi:hypothetical protein